MVQARVRNASELNVHPVECLCLELEFEALVDMDVFENRQVGRADRLSS